MTILAIESSCDETSIGIIKNNHILCNIISSQIYAHQEFGGVVPELASRLHLKNIYYVLTSALKVANIKPTEIDYIAYTEQPGLIGCLHMGKIFAEALAIWLELPLIPINHLEGHIYGARINHNFEFPSLALLVSGGHTQLFYMKKELSFEIIGSTLDDSIGECYDKVARIAGLPYPGGPAIDKLATKGMATYRLPSIKHDKTLDFSYSGLKSACVNLYHKIKDQPDFNQNNFFASFQKAAINQLMEKVHLALERYSNVKTLILAGGVSANSALRQQFLSLHKLGYSVIIPELEYCTDNGAMIAQLAHYKVKLQGAE